MKREITDFEKNVRIALIKQNMNIPKLAQALGISVGYIYELFADPKKPSPQRKRIADYLGFKI